MPVDCDPLVPTTPLQPPEAMHDSALATLQVRTVSLPVGMVVAAAVRVMTGAGSRTWTCVLAELLPLAPLHVTEKTVASVSMPVVMVPFVGWGPDSPFVPRHAVAPTEWITSEVLVPAGTTTLRGVIETTGPVGELLWQPERAATARHCSKRAA